MEGRPDDKRIGHLTLCKKACRKNPREGVMCVGSTARRKKKPLVLWFEQERANGRADHRVGVDSDMKRKERVRKNFSGIQ